MYTNKVIVDTRHCAPSGNWDRIKQCAVQCCVWQR